MLQSRRATSVDWHRKVDREKWTNLRNTEKGKERRLHDLLIVLKEKKKSELFPGFWNLTLWLVVQFPRLGNTGECLGQGWDKVRQAWRALHFKNTVNELFTQCWGYKGERTWFLGHDNMYSRIKDLFVCFDTNTGTRDPL